MGREEARGYQCTQQHGVTSRRTASEGLATRGSGSEGYGISIGKPHYHREGVHRFAQRLGVLRGSP